MPAGDRGCVVGGGWGWGQARQGWSRARQAGQAGRAVQQPPTQEVVEEHPGQGGDVSDAEGVCRQPVVRLQLLLHHTAGQGRRAGTAGRDSRQGEEVEVLLMGPLPASACNSWPHPHTPTHHAAPHLNRRCTSSTYRAMARGLLSGASCRNQSACPAIGPSPPCRAGARAGRVQAVRAGFQMSRQCCVCPRERGPFCRPFRSAHSPPARRARTGPRHAATGRRAAGGTGGLPQPGTAALPPTRTQAGRRWRGPLQIVWGKQGGGRAGRRAGGQASRQAKQAFGCSDMGDGSGTALPGNLHCSLPLWRPWPT